MNAHRHDDPISRWAYQLKEKSEWQKAVVALANKNARILWAVFVRGKPFDAHHVSVKSAGGCCRSLSAALALEDFFVRSLQDVIPKMQSTGQTGGNPA